MPRPRKRPITVEAIEEAKMRCELAKIRLEKAQATYAKANEKYKRLIQGRTIKERAEEIKKSKNLTYDDMAQVLGTTKQYAEQLMKRDRFSDYQSVRLAKALGVTVEFLFTGKESETE